MPAKSRATKPDDSDDDTTVGEPGEPGELCGLCFPDGWGDHETAMCPHGQWVRQ